MVTATITTAPPIQTKFTYLEWQDIFANEKPTQVVEPEKAPPDQKASNITFKEAVSEEVQDARGREPEFDIDVHGFEFYKHASQLTPDQFKDKDVVDELYLPESEGLFRKRFDGVDRVKILHWRTRKTVGDDPNNPTGPARICHVDQSKEHIEKQIRKIYGNEANFLLRGRVRMMNIWRPINGPIQNWPLALCDATSIPESNLVPTDRVRGTQVGNTRYLIHQPGFRWYYQSGARDDEVVLFKCYDTKEDVARYCPHVSFPLPTATPSTPPRESIELRALVFTYPE